MKARTDLLRAWLSSPAGTVALALPVAGLSYIAAVLGHAIVLSKQGVSVLWPACAFLVAVMLLVPRKTWPVLIPVGMAGLMVHDLQFGFGTSTISWLIVADALEILIICLGLGYCFEGIPRLDGWKALRNYSLFAVLLGPFASAFLVAMAVPGSYEVNWRIWFFSQMLAFLTLTPAILSWATADYGAKFRGLKIIEAVALIASLAVLGYFVLMAPWKLMPLSLIYSFVPFLLWAALRFGSMGVSTCMIVLSFLSIWGAIHEHGPFAGPELFNKVLSLQLFLIFAAIPFMVLAALAEERERDQSALSDVSRKLIVAHEEERTWLARELHDDINQRVALVALDLAILNKELPVSDGHTRGRIEEVKSQILELGNNIRALSHRLHSRQLEYLGLLAASAGFCRELAKLHDVEISFESEDIPEKLTPEIALCVFRVLQEALQNAIKHSGAQKFEVSLKGASNELQLVVLDSGVGFNFEQMNARLGLGLTSMKERVRLIDGQLFIDSSPQGGTRIQASVPLARQLKERKQEPEKRRVNQPNQDQEIAR
jgi:signal transduction histidine kinase